MRIKKTGTEEVSHYEINTGLIYNYLSGIDDKKWKNYDREFLTEKVWSALESTLHKKGIVSVTYDGTNGKNLEHYKEKRYPSILGRVKEANHFPFPHYFLIPDKGSEYWNIVEFTEPCVIKKGERHYDLFFALQFSLTDIINNDELPADEFLKYHLIKTFKNNIEAFKQYMERLCLKYKEFLYDKYEPLAKQFFENITPQTEKHTHKEKQLENSIDGDGYPHTIIIPDDIKFKTPIKEYSPKELRGLYDINEKQFRSYTHDHINEIGKLGKSRRYTIRQVYTIFHLIGDPALKNTK